MNVAQVETLFRKTFGIAISVHLTVDKCVFVNLFRPSLITERWLVGRRCASKEGII